MTSISKYIINTLSIIFAAIVLSSCEYDKKFDSDIRFAIAVFIIFFIIFALTLYLGSFINEGINDPPKEDK